jgi:hypothetical protein
MGEETEIAETDETMLAHDATPVCPHCLAQISPLDDYCGRCGEAVGQLTGIIPFVNIRFQTNFYGKLWRKVWYEEDVPVLTQTMCMLCILLLAPFMFVGLPIVIRDAVRARRRCRAGDAGQSEAKSEDSQERDSS